MGVNGLPKTKLPDLQYILRFFIRLSKVYRMIDLR